MTYHQQQQTLERAKKTVGILETAKTFITENQAIEYLISLGYQRAPDYGFMRERFNQIMRAEIAPTMHKRFNIRYRKADL